MKPINYVERNRAISLFSIVYLAGFSLFAYWIALNNIILPKAEAALVTSSQAEMKAMLKHVNEADSLIIRIGKEKTFPAEDLAPFLQWTSDLKATYPTPIFTTVIDSYVDVVKDALPLRGKDSSMAAAQEKLATLKKEGTKLVKENQLLKTQLQEVRKARIR